jgi:hypothetical protein
VVVKEVSTPLCFVFDGGGCWRSWVPPRFMETKEVVGGDLINEIEAFLFEDIRFFC